jgi:putative ubiquitin-RnfH superfamily antitoxin RatB of RatAB toxin-antitoxin module
MARLRVELIRAFPGRHECVTLELDQGATIRTALRVAGLSPGAGVGIFGCQVSLDRPLADGDRVELYRALRLHPREARRRRAIKRDR